MKKYILLLLWFVVLTQDASGQKPVIGFLDFVQDATVEQAHIGFMDALADSGFSEKNGTLEVHYVNAQGDIPMLGQACDLLISKSPDLLATNLTLSTITAVKRSSSIPVFMMVAPRPDLAGLTDSSGQAPSNLSGVYETLDYIDTSVVLIKSLLPALKKIGTIYNQSEPQSQDAFQVLERKCKELGIELITLPVSSSADAQIVTEALLAKKPDAFFALPDNVIFAAFETVLASCTKAGVPIFTSEAGLVSRGAVASFGADFYKWGYQSGAMAAAWLKSDRTTLPPPQIVSYRKQWINTTALDTLKPAESNSSGFYYTSLLLALALVPLGLGIFITLRIFNIPDITTDGSFTLGAAVTAAVMLTGWSHWTALLIAILAGAASGTVTGWIHTRMKVHPLLAGILVMTALYSVNLIIMGRSNVPFEKESGLFHGSGSDGAWLMMFVFVFTAGIIWLLKTDFGLAMRATGNSEKMIRSLGVNTDLMKITGLALANSFTAVSGYLVAQYQHYADINMGIGIVISGLASVMIGESLIKMFRLGTLAATVISVLAGSILFRLVLALVLDMGIDPNYLKLVTAAVVLLIVAIRTRRS